MDQYEPQSTSSRRSWISRCGLSLFASWRSAIGPDGPLVSWRAMAKAAGRSKTVMPGRTTRCSAVPGRARSASTSDTGDVDEAGVVQPVPHGLVGHLTEATLLQARSRSCRGL
ncbi:hypothetical protein ACZ90_66610 [Streptomyces albus subsp. albus]|nr:hypothetical protein ACZ90_66610 [Streptomyces albus subsp. albus]